MEKEIPPDAHVYLQRPSTGGGVSAPLVHPQPPRTSLSRCGKPVADPWFGENVLRFRRFRLDFLSQVSNKHAQVITLIPVVRSPNSTEKFSMRNRSGRL